MEKETWLIPSDVWETRCQWCQHRRTEENRPIHRSELWRYQVEKPCEVMTVACYDRIPGECPSFTPNWIFGVCETCEYNNQFHEGYCRNPARENYRQVFPVRITYQDKAYYTHTVCTCDGYKVNSWMIDIIRDLAASGKVPRNFNPETMEFAEDWPGWAEVDAAHKADIEQKARKAEEDRKAREMLSTGNVPGQISMKDLF